MKIAVFLLLSFVAFVYSTPLVWTLSGVTFNDGGQLTGSFTYDADTGECTDINLVSSGGTTPELSTSATFTQVFYVDGNQIYFALSNYMSSGISRYLNLEFAADLSDQGGVDPILTDGTDSYDCMNCFPYRTVVSGSVSSSPAAPASVCGNGIVEGNEQCDTTSSCCQSCQFASSSVTCRASAGVCDVAETCTGSSASCPPDSVVQSGTVCRAAANSCDLVEYCDGVSTSCPPDHVSNSTSCFCGRQNFGTATMGYYCNANSGFYQCLTGAFASLSSQSGCPSGTVCGCDFGVECSCHGRHSPCVFPSQVTHGVPTC